MGAYALLGDFLTVVNRALPNVKDRLSEMISSEQFQALEKRDTGLALARPPVPEGLVSGLIHREDMVLASPWAGGWPWSPAEPPTCMSKASHTLTGAVLLQHLATACPK
ncbi:MAG: LysR family transcriptional regulator [Micrococcaceae bacterium]|nr:LysR family transcriptional regulator [Micrococcaceae bacterium]